MKLQPDKLFREKLENHQFKMRPEAWSKIESKLQSPRRNMIWWGVAASLAFLLLTSYFLLQKTTPPSFSTSTTISKPEASLPSNSIQSKAVIADIHQDTDKKTPPHPSKINSKKSDTFKPHSSEIRNAKPSEIQVAKETESIQNEVADSKITSIPTEETEEILKPQNSERKTGLYLVYTSNEVNQKYLRSPKQPDSSSLQTKKSSFSKILLAANTIKKNEYSLGDLREIKDELLTFNFFEEKKNNN